MPRWAIELRWRTPGRWRDEWRRFRADPAGQRFARRYRRRESARSGVWRRGLMFGAGLVLLLGGVILLVLPGPGLLGIALGAGMIAEESRHAARFLDAIDLWLEQRLSRWRNAD